MPYVPRRREKYLLSLLSSGSELISFRLCPIGFHGAERGDPSPRHTRDAASSRERDSSSTRILSGRASLSPWHSCLLAKYTPDDGVFTLSVSVLSLALLPTKACAILPLVLRAHFFRLLAQSPFRPYDAGSGARSHFPAASRKSLTEMPRLGSHSSLESGTGYGTYLPSITPSSQSSSSLAVRLRLLLRRLHVHLSSYRVLFLLVSTAGSLSASDRSQLSLPAKGHLR